MLELAILDVNGTLFSLDPVADRLAQVGLEGQLDTWFARILRDGFAAAAAGAFVAFPRLARHHLTVLFDARGEHVDGDGLDHVVDGFTEVTAYPDVEPGLRRLREAGLTVTTMTNGTVEITRGFLQREGLDGLVDATYDVEMAGRWKPAPDAYHYVLEQHELRAERAALIAVHPWDIQGAIHAGLAGAWVNRLGALYPEDFIQPTIEGASFAETVEQLLGETR